MLTTSDWWFNKILDTLEGTTRTPLITKTTLSLHTSDIGLFNNNTSIVTDKPISELTFLDYSRMEFKLKLGSNISQIQWGLSIDDWIDITHIAVFGQCVIDSKLYSKILYAIALNTPITKTADNIIYIPANTLTIRK